MTILREESGASLTTSGAQVLPFTLFDLRLHLGQHRLWVGPAVAGICGAIASGRLGLNSASIISLVLLLFLVDPLLGAVWITLANPMNVSEVAQEMRTSSSLHLSALPYTLPGSLGDRFHRWVNRQASEAPLTATVAAIGGKVLFASGVAFVLGPMVTLVVAIALLWALFWTRIGGHGRSPGARAVYALGLSWLLGYVTFVSSPLLPIPPQLPTSVPAFLISRWALPLLPAVAYSVIGGALWRGRTLTVANLTQMLLVVLLFVLKEPLLAFIVTYALVFQVALQSHRRERGHRWYLRHSQWFVLLGMITVAFGVIPR